MPTARVRGGRDNRGQAHHRFMINNRSCTSGLVLVCGEPAEAPLASRWLHWAVRVVVLPTRILSAVPVWTPDLPLAWGVLLNPTRHAGARGARPRARTVPLDRHGANRLCKTFGPCELFGSKRFALQIVRKMHFIWTKRFASKTFGEISNVNWPFSTKCTNKMHEAFCLCRDIECKLWP